MEILVSLPRAGGHLHVVEITSPSNFRASKALVVFVRNLGTAIMSEMCFLGKIAFTHSVLAATFSYPASSKLTPDHARTTSKLSSSSSSLPSSYSLSNYREKRCQVSSHLPCLSYIHSLPHLREGLRQCPSSILAHHASCLCL